MNLTDKKEEEKIIQNLEKDWVSLLYQIKQIEKINTKRINSITKITGVFNLFLIISFIGNLLPLNFLLILSVIWLTILVRKALIFDSEITNKILSLKSHIQWQEIYEVTEDKFLREYYLLDNIKSQTWEKMLINKATWKYKKKNNT